MTNNSNKGLAVLGLTGILVALGILATKDDLTEEQRFFRNQSQAAEEYKRVRPVVDRAATVSADAKQMASDTIKLELDVIDASISQEGEKLALAIIVRNGMSEGRAKQLGDNFVRLVKTFGPDDSPSKEIGRGRFDYLVGVKTIDGKTVAMGAKVGPSPRITW